MIFFTRRQNTDSRDRKNKALYEWTLILKRCNTMAKISQEIHGQNTGVAAGRDIIIEHVRIDRLTRRERIDLRGRVTRIADAQGMESRELWITLHHAVRVESVEDMSSTHLPTVNLILDLMDENAKLRNTLRGYEEEKQ